MITEEIKITVVSENNEPILHMTTTNKNISLMEFLVEKDYPILATCGGMALCGTCCIEVIKGEDTLPEISDDELNMLESLPHTTSNSRLSCQLPVSTYKTVFN